MWMTPSPDHNALIYRDGEDERRTDTHQHFEGIKECGHDEGNEEEPIHQQQRHTTVGADQFAPIPAQKSEHIDLLQAARGFLAYLA